MQGGLQRIVASDLGQRAIERALRLVAERFQTAPQRVKVLRARYDYRQLDRWHDHMRSLFRIPGVVGTGIDERSNLLEVEISNREARQSVVRRLRELRVPQEAVKFSHGRVATQQASLQDVVRPVVGGQQISRGSYDCTLGIFGYSYRQRRWGFITNSHCTHYMAQNDGTRQYQSKAAGGNFPGTPLGSDLYDAGTEVDDPGWGSCDYWFSSYPCRWSDSAFHALPSWMDPDRQGNSWQSWDRNWWSHGTIALASGLGALNYDGWYTDGGFPVGARWIKAVDRYPVEGTGLDKVGRTTGWTRGTVEDTCDNKLVGGGAGAPRHIIVCAWEADYHSAGGDSGAPVFCGAPPRGEVVLAGLNFASEGFGGNDALFTPIGQIEKDLGSL